MAVLVNLSRVTNQDFSPEEISEVVARIERRNEELLAVGFDFQATVESILKTALPLPEPVLEIATGKGRFLCAMAQHVSQIVTVDKDAAEQRVAKILALAQGVADRIQFLEADATCLPFPDASFGSIVSMNTFHHVVEPFAVLTEMARLVRPSGKVIISDFDEDGYVAMKKLHAKEGRVHPRSAISMDILAEFWRDRGWRVELTKAPCQDIVLAYGPQHLRTEECRSAENK